MYVSLLFDVLPAINKLFRFLSSDSTAVAGPGSDDGNLLQTLFSLSNFAI